MKFNVKTISILSLIGVFLLSAMLCCCLTKIVEAKETKPSCHQTSDEHKSSNNAKECDCDHSQATVKEVKILKDTFTHVGAVAFDNVATDHIYIYAKVEANQAPPIIYDDSPMYIKHSNLRI